MKEEFEIDEQSVVSQIETGFFDDGIFYLVHYFGQLASQKTLKLIKEICMEHHITILEDTTHSIFTTPCTIGDYCIASLRKWMAIPEGGVIYSRNQLSDGWENLERVHTSHKVEAMILKNLFLGYAIPYLEFEGVDQINRAYRNIFANEESMIKHRNKVCRISDLSAFLLGCEDIESLMHVRKENYQFLKRRLQSSGINLYCCSQFKNEREKPVPFTALLLLDEEKERDLFRNYLSDHKIYCAIHWPIKDGEQLEHSNVRKWTKQIISLPIDQRYGIEEMEYLADIIISYLRK